MVWYAREMTFKIREKSARQWKHFTHAMDITELFFKLAGFERIDRLYSVISHPGDYMYGFTKKTAAFAHQYKTTVDVVIFSQGVKPLQDYWSMVRHTLDKCTTVFTDIKPDLERLYMQNKGLNQKNFGKKRKHWEKLWAEFEKAIKKGELEVMGIGKISKYL